ncbi:MAG: hypothetical protein ACXABO_16215 [Promethearchaeota archaeon]|jgi:hypothetical protein
MGAGKILVLIGALLTLVSTFFLSFFSTPFPGIPVIPGIGDYGWGIGFIFNLPNVLSDGASVASAIGADVMVVYIVSIVFIVFLLSGILQLIGLASRVVAVIGSIFPIVVGVLILLISFGILDYGNYLTLFTYDAIAEGIFPFDLALGSVSLGTYTLLGGGVLGLVGGIMGTKDF